ncbi:hypothetical protein [Spiroplasma ixodetis]|nr:hypothetical protein [Spiroplasma ixodetis]
MGIGNYTHPITNLIIDNQTNQYNFTWPDHLILTLFPMFGHIGLNIITKLGNYGKLIKAFLPLCTIFKFYHINAEKSLSTDFSPHF